MPIHYFYIFMTALFAALIMVPFLQRWALDSGTVDKPDARKVHTGTVPRIGGIAIAMAFIFALLVTAHLNAQVRGILAGTLVMFITGMVDDLYGISARKKFLGQIGACLVTIFVADLHIFQLGNLFGTGDILLPPWAAYPFTVFAVVGMINAINLIDGLDGLAGGISVIALASFGLLGYLAGNAVVMLVAAGLLGGVLGFLKYNFYPARIFMGDAGSLSVGFVLGFLAIALTQTRPAVISPIIPVVVLGLPIIDTLWVMTNRLLRHGRPFAPDKTHVHHQFLDLGFNHRFTVLIIYGISLFWALFAVFFDDRPAWLLLTLYLALSLVFYLCLRHISRNQAQYKRLLAFDAAGGLLQTVRYTRLVDSLRFVETLIVFSVLGYFALAALSGQVSHPTTQVTAILLVATIVLIYTTQDVQNDFVLLSFYFAGLVFAYLLESRVSAAGILPRVSAAANLLFLAVVCFLLLRLLLRRPGTLFLSSVDYLIFALNILFAAFLTQFAHNVLLLEILAKGIVLYLAIKLLMIGSRHRVHIFVWFLLGCLAVVVARGMF